MLVKTLEKTMERLTVDGRPPHGEQQNRNQNIGRPQIPQNQARDQRIPPEQSVRLPFQQYYLEEGCEDPVEDEIHLLDSELVPSFLSREYQDISTRQVERSQATQEEAFQKGYQLAMFKVQRQMSLRNREVPIMENRKTTPDTSTGKQKNVVPPKILSKSILSRKQKKKGSRTQNKSKQRRPLSVWKTR